MNETYQLWRAEHAGSDAEFLETAEAQARVVAAVAGLLERIVRLGRGRRREGTPLPGRLSAAR